MDISTVATATATASINIPEAETEVQTRTLPSKPLSFTNGVLKRHHPLHHLNGPPVVVTYKECLKNHAASLGGHAVDGCGEFMPSPNANPIDPTSLKCAACGCHRNFHRREPEEPLPPSTNTAQHVIEYRPHHRHHPPTRLPRGGHISPNSASPPPISSSYYPSAPHMLLALSSGLSGPQSENNPTMTTAAGTTAVTAANRNGRKRFRTKFTQAQKERMLQFAGRVGWKMQKRDEELISEFCSEVGVDRGVFKVWMHNNKNTFGKRDINNDINHNIGNIGVSNGSRNSLENHHHDNNENHHENLNHHHHDNDSSVSANAVATNGSSSSS